MLEIRQLAVNYRGVNALEQIDFQIEPGELVGLIGPNGAGKSTLLKAMLGLIPTAKGTIKLNQPIYSYVTNHLPESIKKLKLYC